MNESVEEQLKNFTEIADLQDKLLSINSYDEKDFDLLYQELSTSNLLNSKWTFRSVLVSIYTCYLCRPHSDMSYINFFIKVARHPKNTFTSDDYVLSFTSNFFLYQLYKNGLVNISSIYEQSNRSSSIIKYFYPEIKQFYQNLPANYKNTLFFIILTIKEAGYQFDENDINFILEKYVELRLKGENPDPIAISIRYDNVDRLQQLLYQTNTPLDKTINQSIFERFVFINESNLLPTLIEYAAFFGSIECFKFLYQKLKFLPPTLAHFAVAGGNYEIIHLCEQKEVIFDDDALMVAIRFFQFDIMTYLEDNFEIQKTINDASKAIVFYNLRALMECEEVIREDPNKRNYGGYTLLTLACLNGDLDIINYLITTFKDKININEVTEQGDSPLCYAAEFGHYEIVRYITSLPGIEINAANKNGITPIKYAAKRGYLNILKFLSTLKNIVIYDNSAIPASILEYSVASQKIDIVRFVWDLVYENLSSSKRKRDKFIKKDPNFLLHKKKCLMIATHNQQDDIIDFITNFKT